MRETALERAERHIRECQERIARQNTLLASTTIEFTDMRAISLGSVLDCSGMASERSGCF